MPVTRARYVGGPVGVGAAIVLVGLIAGIATLPPTQLLYALLAGIVIVGALAAGTFENLLVLWIWAISLVHLMKRAIFLLGPQSQFTYYSVLFLPSLIYAPVLLLALTRARGGWRQPATRVLIAFMAWNLLSTMLFADATMRARLAAVHEKILPMATFIIGLSVPVDSPEGRRPLAAILYSAAVSVVYGVVLYVGGPTLLEREWARGTAAYSIQGQKVLDFILGDQARVDWRGFSYFADPLTWGLLLLAGTASAVVLSCLRDGMRRGALLVWVPVLLLGLFVCLMRTPWAGLVAMLGTYLVLRWKPAQRPAVPALLIAFGFALVLVAGPYLYHAAAPRTGGSPVLERYFATGTIGARVGQWQTLMDAAQHYPVMGAGLTESTYFSRAFGGVDLGGLGGHNFLIETVVTSGVAGLILLLCFFACVSREGMERLRASPRPEAARWLLAYFVGCASTGFLTGSTFLNHYFFLLMGMLVAPRQQPAWEEPRWRVEPSAPSSSATRTWSA